MKKILCIAGALLLAASLLPAAERLSLEAGAAYFLPADSLFRDWYGNSQISPSARCGYRVFKSFHLWVGLGLIRDTGEIPVLEDKIKARQDFIDFGLGWEGRLSGKMKISVEAGAARIAYREEALGEIVSGAKIGFDSAMGLKYFLGQKVYLKPFVSWISGSASVAEKTKKLGGFSLGLRAGMVL